MASATRLKLKNILWIPSIYPRYHVHQDRIDLFADLMSTGKNLPAIKVTEYDGEELIFDIDEQIMHELKNGKYVLLDGKHRLEAHKRLNKEWIEVLFFNTPSESWDLISLRFNAESTLPVSRGELKDKIIQAFLRRLRAGRNTTTHDIATVLGGTVTPRYIRKILKPFRDAERNHFNRKVMELHEKGLTQEQIAQELKVGRRKVQYAIEIMSTLPQMEQFRLGHSKDINNLDVEKVPQAHHQNLKNKIIELKEKGLSREQVGKQLDIGRRHSKSSSKHTEDVPQQMAIGCNVNPATPTTDATDTDLENLKPADIIQFPGSLDSHSLRDDGTQKNITQPVDPDKKGKNPIDYDPRNDEDNAALDIYKLFGLDTPTGYIAMRALELAKQLRWDIPEISEFLDQSIDFVRQVFITALALQVCPNGTRAVTKDKAASTLNLRYDIVDAIAKALHAEAMLAPEGEGMPEWVRANLSESDLELVATIASASGKSVISDDIQYVLVGKTPPRQRTNYYSDVTPELARRMETDMHTVNVVLREYRDMLKTGLLREKALSFFIKVFNRPRSTVNEIDDALISCKKRGYL